MENLETEGIFRLTGSKDEVLRLKQIVDDAAVAADVAAAAAGGAGRSKPFDFGSMAMVENVSSLLKLFLKEIAGDPVVPFALYPVIEILFAYERYIDADVFLEVFRLLIYSFPTSHRVLLDSIISLLTKVLHHSSKNKMTAENLAICLMPSLIRSPPSLSLPPANANSSTAMLSIDDLENFKRETQLARTFGVYIITNYHSIFQGEVSGNGGTGTLKFFGLAIALFSYPGGNDEISLVAEETFVIITELGSDWSKGIAHSRKENENADAASKNKKKKEGYFPNNYVKVITLF